jgi:mycothiol synthase
MEEVLTGLRPYVAADLEELTRLLIEARAYPPAGALTSQELVGRWVRWHADPEHDINVLPGPEGELIAYSRASLVTDPSVRVSMEIAVHPDKRRMGIASALYRLVEQRVRNLRVSHITSPVFLKEGETCPELTGFLLKRNFFPDRSYWQMRLDDLEAQPPPEWPRGFTFRPFSQGSRGDAERWAYLVREAFDEPASASRVLTQLSEPGNSPEGYIFAIDKSTGQEIGTSRARIDTVAGEQVGYVGTVGVLHEYRRKGIAQALVLQTLQYLSSQGMRSAVLFVEGQNYAARLLYTKMGWRSVYQTVHYWKALEGLKIEG